VAAREPKARDKVQCAECGNWFVSVANHVWHVHGVTADEYRELHDLPKANPLTGRDLSELRRELKKREHQENPEALERLLRAGFRGNPENLRVPKSPETLARVGRRHRERSAEWWQQKLAVIGCGTLDQAADWAAERNCGWDEVAQAIGVSPAHVRSTAKKQGLRIRRRVTENQARMLELAAQHPAGPGSLWRVTDPPELGRWLSTQRQVLASGRRHPVHDRLDDLDPDWHLSAQERRTECSTAGCLEAAVDVGLCHTHAERHRRSQRRARANAGVAMVTCLECGAVFRTIKAHLRQVHGMTAAEYQAKHDVDRDALVSPDVVARREERTANLWPQRLAAVGWASWQDAADWAVANDAGWPEIGAHLGGS
jgi:predicted transcriptional regulator